VTDDPRCERIRELAPELALGIADGEERGMALQHLAGCPDCRRTVEELSAVADELLLLAPSREVPIGFESRALEPLQARPPRTRRRRALIPIAAAATAAALAVAGTLLVVRDDLDLASDYRGTLAEADGQGFYAASLNAPGGVRAGTVFTYHGSPSWLMVVLDDEHRATVRGAEVVTLDGERIPLRSFTRSPRSGSWGQALPVDLAAVSVVRVLPADGEALVAKLDR
jgi:hypothetical protein